MINSKKSALLMALLALILCTSMLSAQKKDAQQIGPAPGSQAEYEDFMKVQQSPDPNAQLTMADKFLTTYPESQLTGFIHRTRMQAFGRMNKAKEAIAAGEAGVAIEVKYLEDLVKKADADEQLIKAKKAKKGDKNVIDKNANEYKAFLAESEKVILFYYQSLMNNYQMINDSAKTMEYAEKAMDLDPDNLLTLMTLSGVMAERPATDEAEKAKQQKRAEELAKKAKDKVLALVNGPGGAQMDPEQKSMMVSSAYQTLGLVYLNQKQYGNSQKEYIAAITARKVDPIPYFRLGLAYANENKLDQAMDSLAKSVFLKGPTLPQAKQILEDLYKNKNKSLEGIDQFIAKAGQTISQ